MAYPIKTKIPNNALGSPKICPYLLSTIERHWEDFNSQNSGIQICLELIQPRKTL